MERAEFEIERYLRNYMWQHPLLGVEQKPKADPSLRYVGKLPVGRYDERTGKSYLVPPAGQIWERLFEELKQELSSGRDDALVRRCDRMAEGMLRRYMWAHPFEGAKPKEQYGPYLLWVKDVAVASLGGPDGVGFLHYGQLWCRLSRELEADIDSGRVRRPRAGSGQPNST